MTTPESDPSRPRRRRIRRKPSTLSEAIEHSVTERGLIFESAETPGEIRSRLANEKARVMHELWRDRVVLRCCLVAFPVLAAACLVLVFWPGRPPEVRTWACSTLSGMASGVVCYSLGKSGKGP